MSSYIICKEFSRINESGKLENMGFKTIGEFGKALFGLESSTVNHYARIGTLFITDDYEVNPLLPQLSVSHLLELETYENGDVEKIVIAHKDRLTRFGFDHIEWECQQHSCKIEILNNEQMSPEQEMVQDLMTIIHCFSSRLYGLRNYKADLKRALSDKSL